MVTINFEPGDGTFDVTLSEDEPFAAEWNVPCALVLRHTPAGYVMLKHRGEVLPSETFLEELGSLTP